VRENLEKVRKTLGAQRIISLEQVHGKDIVTLRSQDLDRLQTSPRADGVLTDTPLVGLLIKQADCQAVILYDPRRHVLGNIHCGWRGNVFNILGTAVSRMADDFGCRPGDILAGIGPSLGPCCGEFQGHKDIFPDSFRSFMVRRNYFDLWALSTRQLTGAGLREENIQAAGICTKCHTDVFFSYRAEGSTGRFGTVAMLRPVSG
jgi:YfiH family protein